VLAALRFTAMVFPQCWTWLPVWARESWISGTLQHFDRAKFKIAWSTYQIIGSVSVTLNVEWPPVFQDFLQELSIFSFDFMSPDCIDDSQSFYRTVIIWTIAPIIVSFMIGLSFVVQSTFFADYNQKSTADLLCTHLTYVLVLSYLVLPAVLLKQ